MRSKGLLTAGAVLVAVTAACTASPETDGGTSGTPTRSTTGTPRPSKPGPDLRLEQMQGKKILVGEVSGSAAVKLPAFTPPQKSYTVHFVCSGTGEISLEANGTKWISHPCDGVENAAERITEKEPQVVFVKVSGKAVWKVAVADGPL
ncbi:hypothetical protein [Streptomyces sp. NPDC048623]|uniref:hypothetical protein n=1 Tax=Streptomyces sp. NPDC048623 TaxID=3155761 RepID=UPI0034406EA9